MYRRGADRGWHQGHHREGFPHRNHQSTPYRGGYQDHREKNNYGPYDHNACSDRHYVDNQYMEYQEPTYHDYHEDSRLYHEDSRSYHDDNRTYHGDNRPYHEHREQGYHMRGQFDSGYQKDFRGGYQQNHGESGRYYDISKSQRKKYPYKGFKPQIKESDRLKTRTSKPVEPVVNPAHDAASVGGSSENPSETKTVPSQDKIVTKPEDNSKNHSQDETKHVQNGAKPAQVSAEPTKEDAKLFFDSKMPSEDKGGNPAKEVVKIEHVDTKTEINIHSREQACDTKLSTTEMTTQQVFCKIEPMENSKEDIQTVPKIKEERQELGITGNETQEETFLGKKGQDENRLFTNRTVEIPLLDGWADTPSDSIEATGPSKKRHTEPVVNYGLSHTARELRKAFILAKKEEIELAFSQDCRTFAFVASTLLKKDPTLEVAVSNALRSTLQDIAGRCVQELSKFIDQYDSIPVNILEQLQNPDRC